MGARVHVGDRFVVPIDVSNVPASTGLGSWQFDLDLSADAVTEGSFLSSSGQTSFSPPVSPQ